MKNLEEEDKMFTDLNSNSTENFANAQNDKNNIQSSAKIYQQLN